MNHTINTIQVIRKSLREIFLSPVYISIAFLVAVIVLVFSIWLPNLGLIWGIIASGSMPFLAKITFLWNSLGAISTNFSVLSATLTILVSILLGLNIALMVSYFKRRLAIKKASGVSIAGMLAGFLGVGCASCGSLILSAFIGVGATAAFTGFLTLKGQEFSVLSIAILIGALYITAKKSADPLVCKVELKDRVK